MRTRGDTIEYRPRLDITDSLALESDIVFGTRYISKKRNSAPSKVYKANIPSRNFAPKLKNWEKRKAKKEYQEEERQWNLEVMQVCLARGTPMEEYLKWANEDKQEYKKMKLWERSQKKR